MCICAKQKKIVRMNYSEEKENEQLKVLENIDILK